MKPSKEELMSAWITLAKLIDEQEIEVGDEQFVRTVMNILDKRREKA